MEPIAYTVKDAAAAVGVSEDTIRKAITSEQLPAKDIRSSGSQLAAIRIGRAALSAWFDGLDDYEPPNGGR